jgi:hypothetical protein
MRLIEGLNGHRIEMRLIEGLNGHSIEMRLIDGLNGHRIEMRLSCTPVNSNAVRSGTFGIRELKFGTLVGIGTYSELNYELLVIYFDYSYGRLT